MISAPSRRGLPTARSADHVGINVADLDAAIAFFEDVLGASLLYRAGPFEDRDGDWMTTHLGVHPRASVNLAMLRFGPTMNVELLSFEEPDVDRVAPGNSSVGSAHLAIYVDDLGAAARYLSAHPGVRLLGEPTVINGDLPLAGTTLLYVSTPIGVRLELISRTGPLPYEVTTSARLWGPAASWTSNARMED